MARFLGLIVLLAFSGATWAVCDPASPTATITAAACTTKAEARAWANAGPSHIDCAQQSSIFKWPFIDEWSQGSTEYTSLTCKVESGQGGSGFFRTWGATWETDAESECQAGLDYWAETEPAHPDELVCSQDGCEAAWTGWGVGGQYLWSTTGEACESSSPDDMDPDTGECHELGSGFTWCPSDPPFCVRSPGGGLLCPDIDQPDCRSDPSGILCQGKDPPRPDWNPEPPFEYCRNFQCVIFQPGLPEDDDDDDDDGDDEECEPGDPDCDDEEDEPDCPPNDPDCEDDDDDNAPRAADSGCETETPSCSDMGHVDCQILIRTHRTNCTAAYGNKMLEEFRDRQIEEVRETNAKLKALKDTFILSTDGIVHTIEGEVGDRLKQVTEKLRDIQRDNQRGSLTIASNIGELRDIMATGTSVLVTTVDGQTLELGNKLDDVERAIGNQTAAIVGDGVDPGSGATEADLNAIQVRSVTNGPVSPDVINMQGFLGGGSCPDFGTFTLAGIPWQIDNTFWCDFLSIIKACMYLLAVYWSVMILLGK